MSRVESASFPSRQYWRELLLPTIEREVAYVAKVQKTRTPFLDSYNKAWSFLGSHATYIIGLPLVFWLGEAFYARHLTMLMGIGLVLCNIVKDALCLPRPTSPPVERLSKTHQMEYGFPSSHSVNALNLPLFTVYYFLAHSGSTFSWVETGVMVAVALFVTSSISYSRIYCGMHCPTDLLGGFLVGILLLGSWIYYLPEIEDWVTKGENTAISCISVMALFLYLYPTPMSHTPTFDDSVAFSFTIVGIVLGTNMFASNPLSSPEPYLANYKFHFGEASWILIFARAVVGILLIVGWRALGKFVCKIIVPPIFNLFDDSPTPSSASTETLPNGQKGPYVLRRFDEATASRIIVYLGVGLITAFLASPFFNLLGLDN